MRAVVTRPVEDAERIAAPLRDRGVEVFVEPLLAVVTAAAAEVSIDGVQAFLLTSANGARALAAALKDAPHGLQLPALCVGDQTMRVARELGFSSVLAADGDVESLAALVRRTLRPANGDLLHAAGSVVAGDLRELLEGDGFQVRRKVLYETRAAKGFSSAFQTLMHDGAVDCVLLYSPRTARTFADLATRDDLRDACRDLTAYCLSQAVADALGDLPFHRVRVAPEPNQEALLSVFDEDNAYAFARVPSQAGDEDPEGDGTMTERPKAGKTSDEPKTDKDGQGSPTPPSGKDAPAPKESKDTKDAKDAKDAKDTKAGKDAAKPETKPEAKPAAAATPKSTAGGPAAPAPGATPAAGAMPGASRSGEDAATAPAPARSGVSGAVVAVLVVLIVLLGLWATLPMWRGALPQGLQDATAPMVPGGGGEQVAVLEGEVAGLRDRVSALTTSLDELQQRVSALESASAPVAGADGALTAEAREALRTLQQRVDELAQAQPQNLEQQVAALDERLREIQASRAEASTVLNLTDRVARVEDAVRQQEARQATAVAFLVSVGQLRAAVDSGRAFEAELRSARAVAPEGVAVEPATDGWADWATQGVPTLTGLRQAFAERSDAILRASVNLDEGDGWWDRTLDRMLSVVSVRRTDGEAVGDAAAAVVSRAEQDLEAGDLSAAITEVEKLSGAAEEAAAEWLAAARARLAAEEGLAALTGEALARLQAAQTGSGAQGSAPASGQGDDAASGGTTGQEG